MKILMVLAVGLMISAGESKAETIIGFHTSTYHFERNAGYKEFNPGVYVVKDSFTAGIYANSERKTSVYVGYSLQYEGFSLTIGGVTGYSSGLQPMIVPSYKIPGTYMRVAYLPQVPNAIKNTQGFHFSFEF